MFKIVLVFLHLRLQDLGGDTAKNQNTQEDPSKEVDEEDCEEEEGEEEAVEEDEVVQDSLMEENMEAEVEPAQAKSKECPDNFDTLPMVFPEEPFDLGTGQSGPGEFTVNQVLEGLEDKGGGWPTKFGAKGRQWTGRHGRRKLWKE